jgi:hypothetical protein
MTHTTTTTPYHQVPANSRTYGFRIKKNRAGREYLEITERRSGDSAEACSRIVIFQQHMAAFHKAYLKEAKRLEPKLRIYDMKEIREHYPNAFKLWTPQQDERLVAKFHEGLAVIDLAKLFGRQPGGIRSRLKSLGLNEAPRLPRTTARQRSCGGSCTQRSHPRAGSRCGIGEPFRAGRPARKDRQGGHHGEERAHDVP